MSDPAQSPADLPRETAGTAARFGLAWWPIPLLAWAMVALRVMDQPLVRHLAWLDWLAHRCIPFLALLLIVVPAARTFPVSRRLNVLMLGCGLLVLQIALAIAPLAFAQEADTAFAIYNTCALLSALCHLSGLGVTHSRTAGVRRPAAWLATVYSGGVAAVALIAWLAFTGRMPVFFIDGQGGTRAVVVSAAVGLLLLAAALLQRMNRSLPSPFLRWYGPGLVLLAISLAGS